MKKLLSILMAMLLLFSCAAAEIIVDIGPVIAAASVGGIQIKGRRQMLPI